MTKSFDDFKRQFVEEQSADMAIDAFEIAKKTFASNSYTSSNPEIEELLTAVSSAIIQSNVLYTMKALEAYHNWRENQ